MSPLDEILRQYPPVLRPTEIVSLGSAGGMSGAQFWQLVTPRGKLALRRWPAAHPTPGRLRFIHAVLDHATRHGVAVIPLPIHSTAGKSFVENDGHLWELAPWMPGSADYDRAPNIQKLQAALRTLARFHNATQSISVGRQADSQPTRPQSAVARHLQRLHKLSHGGTHELTRAITDATWPKLEPLVRQFLATLPRAIPAALAQLAPLASDPLPLQPCLRDIWHDHVLFTGDEVTGLIDFGAVDIDTPATDIARLLGSLATSVPLPIREGTGESSRIANTWRDGLAAYSEVRPISHAESLAASALDVSGTILAGCNWIRWIYLDGRQFENAGQVLDRFRKIASRCSEQLGGDIAFGKY